MVVSADKRKLLRGFALIVVTVIAVDWFASALAQRFLGNVIYNPRPPSLLLLALFLISFPFLLVSSQDFFRGRSGAIGCGLCCGGSVANLVSRIVFGPVPDFIPVPFMLRHWECDPADLAIYCGSIIVLSSLVFAVWQKLRKPVSPTAPTVLAETSPWDWA